MSVKGVVQTNRKTWDKETFQKKAEERAEREEEEMVEPKRKTPAVDLRNMKPAAARTAEVDLESQLGKTQVITTTTPSNQTGGFYCEACDCVIKDSQNYLDHINGKKHQRNLGTSLRPERATLDQVRARLKLHKEKQEVKKDEDDFDRRMERLKEQEEQRKQDKLQKKKESKKKKKEKDQKQDAEAAVVDPDMAAFGLPAGFK